MEVINDKEKLLKLKILAKGIYKFEDLNADNGKVHNWRSHIPESIKELWPNLTENERLLVVITAENSANAEEWN